MPTTGVEMTNYRTCVYIDGFNFYYSIKNKIKNNIVRYPSLKGLCRNKLDSDSFEGQKHDIIKIHYFTAEVCNSAKLARQKEYNEALEKEGVEIHLGRFIKDPQDPNRQKRTEKSSDVNLATQFIYDACNDNYDYAVIISNDTDFCGMIEFVLEKFDDKEIDVWAVGAISPTLSKVSTTSHIIKEEDLKNAKRLLNFHPKFARKKKQ